MGVLVRLRSLSPDQIYYSKPVESLDLDHHLFTTENLIKTSDKKKGFVADISKSLASQIGKTLGDVLVSII